MVFFSIFFLLLLFACFILSLFFSFSFFLYDSSMKLSLSVLGIVFCIVPRCPRYGAVKIKVSRNPKPESAHARIQPVHLQRTHSPKQVCIQLSYSVLVCFVLFYFCSPDPYRTTFCASIQLNTLCRCFFYIFLYYTGDRRRAYKILIN